MRMETVKYTDFNGNERTEDLYFNLTQVELVEMATDLPDTVTNKIGNDPSKINTEEVAVGLVESIGNKGILEFIKKLVLKSYGVKTEDGRGFRKIDENGRSLSIEFSQTLAFDTLMMKLMADENAAAEFVNHVIPANVVDKIGAQNMAVLK